MATSNSNYFSNFDPNSLSFGSKPVSAVGFGAPYDPAYVAPSFYTPRSSQQNTGVQPPGVNTPWQQQGFGMNLGTAQLAFNGLSSLGNMYAAFNANKLAKKSFEFQKGVTETNLANSIQSYNTKLTDRAAARAVMTGQSEADRDAYVEKNKAVRR